MTLPTAAAGLSEVRPWAERFVRLGYAAKGLIYLLIGVLALRLALGFGGRLTDASGVLRTVLQQPFGLVLMAAIGTALLAYAAWEIIRAFVGTRRQPRASSWGSRVLTVLKAMVYGGIEVEALRLAFGSRARSGGADDLARDAMQLPLGGALLALAGLGLVAYGLRQVWHAWQARIGEDLDNQQLRRDGAAWVLHISRAGVGARGVILALIGMALLRAAIENRPGEAGGTSEALSTVLTQPYGQTLLAAVAAGLACYGVYQFVHARYARI
jgi:hypothetical protein